MPKLKEELITVYKYKIKGDYSDERQEKHAIIITNKLKGKMPSQEKSAILLGGGSGAGKSTIVKEHLMPNSEDFNVEREFVFIDADDIKTYLEEYKMYIENEETVYFAAYYVHAESGDIVNMLLQKCIDLELSFIYDGTMSWKPLYDDLLPKLKNKSYQTLGIYVDVDVLVAAERVKKRGVKEKRFVDEEVVKKANRNSAIVFKQLKPQFDQVLMFNNTVERTEDSNIISIPFYRRETSFTELFNGEIKNKKDLELFIKKSEEPYIE